MRISICNYMFIVYFFIVQLKGWQTFSLKGQIIDIFDVLSCLIFTGGCQFSYSRKWAWLCSNKTLFTKRDGGPGLTHGLCQPLTLANPPLHCRCYQFRKSWLLSLSSICSGQHRTWNEWQYSISLSFFKGQHCLTSTLTKSTLTFHLILI